MADAQPSSKRVKTGAAPKQTSSFSLGAVLGADRGMATNAGRASVAAKKAKPTGPVVPNGESRFDALARKLLDAQKGALALGLSPDALHNEVEVEARVGLVHMADVCRRYFPSVEGRGERAIDMDMTKTTASASSGGPGRGGGGGRGVGNYAFQPGVSLLAFRGIQSATSSAPRLRGVGRHGMHELVHLRPGNAPRVAQVLSRTSTTSTATVATSATSSSSSNVSSSAAPHTTKISTGPEAPRAETKDRVVPHCDLALPSCPFDLRLSVQREEAKPLPNGGNYVSGSSGTRRKRRESLVAPPDHPDLGCWQLDLTTVTSEEAGKGAAGGGGNVSTSYEVELELTKRGRMLWLGSGSDNGDNGGVSERAEPPALRCREVARQLLEWLDLVNPPEEAASGGSGGQDTAAAVAGEQLLGPVPVISPLAAGDPLTRAAQSICEHLVTTNPAAASSGANGGGGGGKGGGGGGGRHGGQFPGAMPVNLCRHHIPVVQQSPYYVTEKTDGVRQLLVAVPRPPSSSSSSSAANPTSGSGGGVAPVLVDRSMLRGPGGNPLGLLCKSFGTVATSSSPSSSAVAAATAVSAVLALLPEGTVLDGEVVHNLKLKRPVFMVFDVLQLGGQDLRALPWSKRVACLNAPSSSSSAAAGGGGVGGGSGIGGGVLLGLKSFLEATQTAEWCRAGGLMVVAKRFWQKERVDLLLRNMEAGLSVGGTHTYRIRPKLPPQAPPSLSPSSSGDQPAQQQQQQQQPLFEVWHKTDGVILQPDAPYTSGTDFSLLKWKFLDTVTVDLAARLEDGVARFSCVHSGGFEVDVSEHCCLGWSDTARLAADIAGLLASSSSSASSGSSSSSAMSSSGSGGKGGCGGGAGGVVGGAIIAEVGLDPGTGEWFYKGLRPDKDRPNALHTVMSTLIELAENVGAEELEARLLASVTPTTTTTTAGAATAGAAGAALEDTWETERSGQAKDLLDAHRQRADRHRKAKKPSKKR